MELGGPPAHSSSDFSFFFNPSFLLYKNMRQLIWGAYQARVRDVAGPDIARRLTTYPNTIRAKS
jgi:hypothetical protein